MAAQSVTRRQPGFTLVEVLVALFIMSMLAVMAWQGVDGMVRARDASQQRLEATLRLNTALAQWQQDLAAVQDTPSVPGLHFNGAALQLTRRAANGLQLVVWSVRDGRWQRWAGPAATSGSELQDSWMRSQQLQGGEPAQVTVLEGAADWQIYFFRESAWTNAQSSGDAAPADQGASAPAREVLPSGVRMVLNFAQGSGFAGSVTRDTVLGPQP